MYQVVARTTRIPTGIIDAYDNQFFFEVSQHYCAMQSRLPDGSVNVEEEVETLPFVLIERMVQRALERWAQAEVEQRKQQGKHALPVGGSKREVYSYRRGCIAGGGTLVY